MGQNTLSGREMQAQRLKIHARRTWLVIGQSGWAENQKHCPGKDSSACFEFRRDNANAARGNPPSPRWGSYYLHFATRG